MNRAYSRAGIISRLFNTPLAVTPQTASIVLGAVGDRLDVSQLFVAASSDIKSLGELEELAAEERLKIESRGGTDRRAKSAPADRLMFVHDRVAHVGIRGELVSENGIGPSSGFTGYDGIVASVQSADADPNVAGILVDIDSPGGEVASLYECVNALMARRGTKPMRAMIRGMGCSAAYAIAACADPGQITLHDLGYAGSVGTIAMHADYSENLEQKGIKVTLFTAGEHKADGNPFEALPEHVARDIQAMIDIANSRFIAHVAKARGMSEDDVRAQQAHIYRGDAAVKAGLVDKVMSWQDSMDEFEAIVNDRGARSGRTAPSGARSTRKDNSMSNEANAPAAEEQPGITQEAHDAAVAEARTEATTAERERITGITEIDAASTISDAASAAIESGQSVGDFAIDQAKASKDQKAKALADAKSEAAKPDELPAGSANATGAAPEGKPNRGQALVEKRKANAA